MKVPAYKAIIGPPSVASAVSWLRMHCDHHIGKFEHVQDTCKLRLDYIEHNMFYASCLYGVPTPLWTCGWVAVWLWWC